MIRLDQTRLKKTYDFQSHSKDLGPINLQFPLIISTFLKQKWEFFFEKFPPLKKEFPLLLNRKWEQKQEFSVGIVDKQDLGHNSSSKINLEISHFLIRHIGIYPLCLHFLNPFVVLSLQKLCKMRRYIVLHAIPIIMGV